MFILRSSVVPTDWTCVTQITQQVLRIRMGDLLLCTRMCTRFEGSALVHDVIHPVTCLLAAVRTSWPFKKYDSRVDYLGMVKLVAVCPVLNSILAALRTFISLWIEVRPFGVRKCTRLIMFINSMQIDRALPRATGQIAVSFCA